MPQANPQESKALALTIHQTPANRFVANGGMKDGT